MVLADSRLLSVSFEERSVWSSTVIGDCLFESKISSWKLLGVLPALGEFLALDNWGGWSFRIKMLTLVQWPLLFTSFGVVYLPFHFIL